VHGMGCASVLERKGAVVEQVVQVLTLRSCWGDMCYVLPGVMNWLCSWEVSFIGNGGLQHHVLSGLAIYGPWVRGNSYSDTHHVL